MTNASNVKLWQAMAFRDPDAMIAWLSAIGFTEHATYRDEQGQVVHAEWLWPEGGGIMFGVDTEGIVRNAGGSATYLVCADPDERFDKAVAAGATVVRPMQEEGYGGRGGSVADPEGNQWSFGDYQP